MKQFLQPRWTGRSAHGIRVPLSPCLLVLLVLLAVIPLAALAGGGDADYGRGPESDPVASAALVSVTGDVAVLKGQTSGFAKAMTDAVSATGNVATLQGQMTTVTGDVAVLKGQTSGFAKAMTDAVSATGNVATLQGQMTTVTGDVAVIQGQTGGFAKAMTDAVTATGALVNVWSAPGLTPSTNLLVNTVTIQAKNAAGGNLAQYRVMHVWVSTTDQGAASTNNIESLVLSTGSPVSTVTTNADYWYTTAVAGSAVATVTATAAGTNYIMCADGSSINSAAIVFH